MAKLKSFDLIMAILLSFLCIISIIIPYSDVLRNIFGIIFVTFLPGYAFISAIYPYKNDFDFVTKFSLSFGLSIAIVTLITLFLNYSNIGINTPCLISGIGLSILSFCIISYYRRSCLEEENKAKSKNRREVLIVSILILLSFLPLMVLSSQEVTQEYTYRHMAFAEASKDVSFMNPFMDTGKGYDFQFVALYPGHDLFIITLLKISSIPIEVLQFLPLMGFVLVLLYYSLTKTIFNSRFIGFMLAISVIAFDLSFSMLIYNTWYYSMTYVLYLSFLILFLLKKKSSSQIIAVFLIFLASFFIHHTVAVWIIMALIITNGLYFILSRWSNSQYEFSRKFHDTINILTAFFVIYLGFNQVFYKQVVPKLDDNVLVVESSSTFINTILDIFKYTPQKLDQYVFSIGIPLLQNPTIGLVIGIRYLVILLPIMAYLLLSIPKIIKKFKSRSFNLDPIHIFILVVLTTGLVDYLIYSSLGRPSLKYLIFIFPIITIFSLQNLFKNIKMRDTLIRIFLIVLLCLSCAKFALFWENGFGVPSTTYEDIKPSSQWLIKHSDGEPSLVTDMHTFGKYLVEGAKYKKFFEWTFYTSEIYDLIVNKKYSSLKSSELSHKGDYLILDKKSSSSAVVSLFWNFYEPLIRYLDNINDNTNLNKIYDDGNIQIYGIGAVVSSK